MKLQISFWNHLQALKFHLIGTFLMLVALYLLKFDSLFLIVFLITWVLYTLPTLYLHFKYYLINRRQEIIITNDEIIIKYNNKEDSHILKKTEIENIVLCRSASMDKGGIPLSSIETYQYINIISKTGTVIIITNLMTAYLDDVLNQFQGIRFSRIKGLSCIFAPN